MSPTIIAIALVAASPRVATGWTLCCPSSTSYSGLVYYCLYDTAYSSMVNSYPSSVIAVVGLGYIGLPTAVILALHGHPVVGVDISSATVNAVNAGTLPFYERDLDTALAGVISRGQLHAQMDMPRAGTYIVAVPTPFKDDHSADMSFIRCAAASIAPVLEGGELIILESTSPPGTTHMLAQYFEELRPDLRGQLLFAHAPERVMPGRIMTELIENDRIIGGLTPEASSRTRDLYATFCRGALNVTDAKTAEMTKLTENAFRDVNIAFANEISMIADSLGVDVWELITLANKHPRVTILQPGPGVGGHCIAVDPWFIVGADPENSPLIRTAREVNETKPAWVEDKIRAEILRAATPSSAAPSAAAPSAVALLGLSFKANVGDLRESPALRIATDLVAEYPDVTFLVSEPNITELPARLSSASNTRLVGPGEAIASAGIIVLLVDHREFREITPAQLSGKCLIDTKGFWHGAKGAA